MKKVSGSWKRRQDGYPSTSGTTVGCVVIRPTHMFIANVGDSAVVLGTFNPKHKENGGPEVVAKLMTRNHTPHDKDERERVEALGGSVLLSKGVLRVVWQRESHSKKESMEPYERIPKLNMTRSLGDLWSITKDNQYLISPIPDVCIYRRDHTNDKYLILGSDGLWNMITPQQSIDIVHALCKDGVMDEAHVSMVAKELICRAIQGWRRNNKMADNTSVIFVCV